jgi:hypothetical protein
MDWLLKHVGGDLWSITNKTGERVTHVRIDKGDPKLVMEPKVVASVPAGGSVEFKAKRAWGATTGAVKIFWASPERPRLRRTTMVIPR